MILLNAAQKKTSPTYRNRAGFFVPNRRVLLSYDMSYKHNSLIRL
jgi:hypothetical protein